LEPIAKERFKQLPPTPTVATPNHLPRSVSNPGQKPSSSARSGNEGLSGVGNAGVSVPATYQAAAVGAILSPMQQSDRNLTGTSGSFSGTL